MQIKYKVTATVRTCITPPKVNGFGGNLERAL